MIGDADGLGYPIMVSLKNALDKVVLFKGAQTSRTKLGANARADGYLAVKEMIENNFLKLNCKNAARQLEYIKTKFSPNTGKMYILDKKEIRKIHNESPDYSDCLMMGIYGIQYYPEMLLTDELKEAGFQIEIT